MIAGGKTAENYFIGVFVSIGSDHTTLLTVLSKV